MQCSRALKSIVRSCRGRAQLSSSNPLAEPGPSRIIFSGIQPTGVPHIGNYLGALQNWVKLQRDAMPEDQLIFSVVGWHALTLPQDPRKLAEARNDMFATLIAIGLDPQRSIIFHQDHNPDHTELAWILNCLTPFGKLRRMTTWKSRLAVSRNANDESEVDETMLNTGLFSYPILQAADILAYRSSHVPVGEDQQQHLELSRDIAEIFNRQFATSLFPLPEYVNTPARRVLSLRDPASKMSKSAKDENSRILVIDEFSTIRKKIRSAVTDSDPSISFDPENRPGTSNLLTIFAGFTGEDVRVVTDRYRSKRHEDLKNDLVDVVEESIKSLRSEFRRLRNEKGLLDGLAKHGAEKAQALSQKTLSKVRRLVGLSSR